MTNLTLYQTLFDLELTLCERLNMSPFDIRRESLYEVCTFLERLNDHSRRKPRNAKGEPTVRRHAGNNWF